MAKEKKEPVAKKENEIWELEILYKGQKSRKGTYFPYLFPEGNKYGIVGQIYFPVDKGIPDELILRPPKGKQTA